MKTTKKSAKDIQRGDVIILNWGYGPQSDDRESTVLDAISGKSLFDQPEICFTVDVQGIGIEHTIGFSPNHMFDFVRSEAVYALTSIVQHFPCVLKEELTC